MFVFLSKMLPLFIYPTGAVFLLLILALLFCRGQKHLRIILLTTLLIIFLSGNRWLSYSLARTLEWKYLPDHTSVSAHAIVVLGGGTESNLPPRQGVEVNSAGDRMIHAADLYHTGMAPIILLSGGNVEWMDSLENSPAGDMRQILLKLNVPDSAMILQTKSQNTYEDAVFSAKILKEKGISKIILITSAMHMPRSVGLFEKQGITVIPSPTDFTVTEDGWRRMFSPNLETFLTNIVPNSSSIGLTTSVMKEYIGMIVYRLQGWL
ncbi:hypothetical protein hrd7_23270 [Leptolinea sp. HRD-7]|nr:hypothetical protein hrd7_23270 [Leptolinea sp. HRD-7]